MITAEKPLPDIKSLTGLRGIAALWVCLLHYTWGWSGNGFPLEIARHGGAGLVTFFVLSGFILAYVYGEKLVPGSIARAYPSFLWARFARIYPLHLMTLLIFGGLALLTPALLTDADTAYTFLLNLLLLHAWGFTNTVTWNQPSWSVSTEAFAYLLFPLFVGRIFRASNAVLAGIALLSILSVWSTLDTQILNRMALAGWIDVKGLQFAYGASLLKYLLMFLLGVVAFCGVARVRKIITASWPYDAAFLAGVAALLYLCTIPESSRGFALAAALVIVGLYRDAGLGRLAVGNPVVVFLGEVSYALYLSHLIVPALFNTVLLRLGIEYWWAMIPLVGQVAAALAVAAALHFGFERPARKFVRGLATRGPAVPPSVSVQPALRPC